jgi:TonB-linked SusC/RagA family outer membrane protein
MMPSEEWKVGGNAPDFALNKKLSFSKKSDQLQNFLREALTGISVQWELKDNYIILSKRAQSAGTQQTKHLITGVVTDQEGQPVIGASIKEQGTTNGTITDMNGHFVLRAADNATLEISYLGFQTQTIALKGRRQLIVALAEDSKRLNEVVVVGYGTQKKVNLTGSISTVDTKVLMNRPITQASQALQGVSGVYVNQAGGQPGADGATIRIRGVGTMNNSDPLILVDGIEYELNAINPNDIENISVLKDAASAAIYGSRAANGVILITTKKGKSGENKISYNNYFGVQKATYLPDFVYDPIVFMQERDQAQINEGKATVDYSQALIDEYKQGMKTDPITYPDNNWLDIMFNDAFIMEHDLRFSGGTDKFNYSLSLNYGKQDGVLRGTSGSKYMIGLTLSNQMNKWLRVGMDVHGLYRIMDQPVSGVANLMEMTFKATAFHPTYLADGRYADTFIRTPGHKIYRHPLALADEGKNQTKRTRILADFTANIKLPWDISYDVKIGIAKNDAITTLFSPEVYEYQVKTLAPVRVVFDGQTTQHLRKTDDNDLNKTLFHTLSWNRTFNEKHNVKVLLGQSYEDFYTSNFYGQREGYLSNDLYELDAGSSNPTVGGTSAKNALLSYFGRVNYNLAERYLFEANFRYDGSSRFAKGNRWGLFPSFSAGWRLSEEPFMKKYSWLDNLKLRASFGQLGNERISAFRYVDLINSGYNYAFNGTITTGTAVDVYNDPNITWETTTITNIGVDATLWRGSVDFSFELFNKRTSNILRTVEIPQQVGDLTGPIQNIGKVDNKGFEIGLAYQKRFGKLGFRVNGELTYIKNRIVDLKGQTTISGNFILKEGEPIDSYYMLHCIGIFQSEDEIKNSPYQTAATKPGYLKFEDVTKDGKITDDDRTICGGVIPRFTYSFGLDLSYGQFNLNALFQGVNHVYTYGDRIGATPFWFGCGLPKQWLTDSWTPERGTSATLPILTTYEGALNENYRVNDFWLRDASYLRMKNIQLTYTFAPSLLRKTPIHELKLFVNGQNLLTFSPMKDFDPEKNLEGSTFYAYPSIKMFTGGINITF